MLRGRALEELQIWLGQFCDGKGIVIGSVRATTIPRTEPRIGMESSSIICTSEMNGYSAFVDSDLSGFVIEIHRDGSFIDLTVGTEILGDDSITSCDGIDFSALPQLAMYHGVQVVRINPDWLSIKWNKIELIVYRKGVSYSLYCNQSRTGVRNRALAEAIVQSAYSAIGEYPSYPLMLLCMDDDALPV